MLFHANVFPSLKQCFFHSGKKEHGTCTPIVCPSMPVQTSLLYPQSVSLKVCLLKFKNMTIKIQNSKTWPSKTWPSNCISQSMSLTIQKHDPQNSKFKNMTFKNMTLKVYLSKYYCISQKFSKYVPKNSKHDHHNSKTWPSKCISQSVSPKVAIFNAPDLIQILPRHNSWGGASLYSSSLVLGGLARDKIGLKLDCLVQGNKTRNQFHQTAQPHLSYGPKGSYSGSSFLEKG